MLNKILLYKEKLIIFLISKIKIIFYCYYNLLPKYFNINKLIKLIFKKYYLFLFKINIKNNINRYNIYIKVKFTHYKLYNNL